MATIFDQVILAKLEVTKGTDPTPAPAADAVRVKSFKIKKNTGTIDRKVVKQTMGDLAHLIGKETVSIEIQLELRGQGAAGTAPETSPLLQACRLGETIVASTSVTYKPTSATEKSCTIYAYKDGLLWKLIGAVGTAKIEASMEGVLLATFTMQAAYVAPTAVSAPGGSSFDATQPLVMSHATVISDGASIKVGKIAFDLGNDVQHHYVTSESSFVVANRSPTATFSKDSVNTAAEWTALAAGTTAALSAAFGATAGNICTITAPVAKRKEVGYSERAERHLLDLTYALYESTSDDQISIAFT